MPERVHDDDLALFGAVVHPDGIGVRDVAARFFHRDGGVEGETRDGEIDEVARLVQSGEVSGDEDDRKHHARRKDGDERDRDLFAVAFEPHREFLSRLLALFAVFCGLGLGRSGVALRTLRVVGSRRGVCFGLGDGIFADEIVFFVGHGVTSLFRLNFILRTRACQARAP